MSNSDSDKAASPRALVAATLLGEAVAAGGAAAFVWADESYVVAANEAASTLSGYGQEELLGLSFALVVNPWPR